MIILKLLRLILPPFHPLKYRWIEYWYGPQHGGYFDEEQKYPYVLLDTDEYKDKIAEEARKFNDKLE